VTTEEFFLNLIKNGHLEVYENGRVYNNITKKFFSETATISSARTISVRDKDLGKIRSINVHRLVWIRFNGLIDQKVKIINKPGCTGVAIESLEATTATDPRVYKACVRPGEKNLAAVLTEERVKLARERYAKGDISIKALADEEPKVSKITMRCAVLGLTWGHIEGAVTTPDCRKNMGRKNNFVSKPKAKQKKVSTPALVKTIETKSVEAPVEQVLPPVEFKKPTLTGNSTNAQAFLRFRSDR